MEKFGSVGASWFPIEKPSHCWYNWFLFVDIPLVTHFIKLMNLSLGVSGDFIGMTTACSQFPAEGIMKHYIPKLVGKVKRVLYLLHNV